MQKRLLLSIYSYLFYIWFHFSNASSLYSSFGSIHLSSVWEEKSHEMFFFLFSGWKKIRLNYLHTHRTGTFEDKDSHGDMISNCSGPQNRVIRFAALVQDMQLGNTSGCQYRQLVSLDRDSTKAQPLLPGRWFFDSYICSGTAAGFFKTLWKEHILFLISSLGVFYILLCLLILNKWSFLPHSI